MSADLDKFITSFNQIVSNSRKILITAHKNPDDDAISSVLAVKLILEQKYPHLSSQIVIESPLNNRWRVFAGFDQIQTTNNLSEFLLEVDTLIMLDGNQFHRFTKNPEAVNSFTGKKICIDHHASAADAFDIIYSQAQATATAELIYDLFYCQNRDLAKILLLGILGDTGNLIHVSYKQSRIFSIVKTLVEDAQVQIQAFKATYDYVTPSVIELVKILINSQENKKIAPWPECKITFLPAEALGRNSIIEIKEAVDFYQTNFNLIEQNVSWAMTFYPSEQGINISARSTLGSVNVRRLMEALEVGGGHDLAAGGIFKSEQNVESIVSQVISRLPNITPSLTQL